MVYVDASCSAADCDWPVYDSLAICAATKNITDFARNSNDIKDLTKKKITSLINSSSASPPLLFEPHFSLPAYMIVSNVILAPTGAFNQTVVDAMHADLFVAYSNNPINISAGFDGDLSSFHFIEMGLF